jgi:NAD(P)-dependent dehydrogenase (short-subunit alcohol dehydrogenase family)
MVSYGAFAYTASKHAVVGLTRTAAVQYSAKGIRVNCVCPGAIRTPMVQTAIDQGFGAVIEAMHPIGRIGEPIEVAAAVLWLCSDQASFVTGHPLAVDGGALAR